MAKQGAGSDPYKALRRLKQRAHEAAERKGRNRAQRRELYRVLVGQGLAKALAQVAERFAAR